MSKKVCLLSLSVMGMIFINFSLTATSLKCYNCHGAKKEPDQDAGCSNTTKNCSGSENTCMIHLTRNKLSEPQVYHLTCKAKVDCERLGVGCIKNNDKTICTKCCSTDLCNTRTTYSATLAPPTSSTSRRTQILPIIFFLTTLTVFWFCD
ncbi:uncharacterized protein LOC110040049 [Orbicella faveolata]|uniref:uncharacterized protein LOC110040049 n=1 Tax=Orbicella faveolata TaxID=48498 RepID=UPI0009E2BCE1|nr:uncharacterized protein LOC110040049 [Orbicella faveolata]